MGLKISALERDLSSCSRTSSSAACSLDLLPSPTLILVLQLLSHRDRLRAARCSRRLLTAARSPAAWQCAAPLPYPFYSAHWAARLRRSLLALAPFELRVAARRLQSAAVADLLLLPNIRAVRFDDDAAASEAQLDELLASPLLADVAALRLSPRCQLRPHHTAVVAERMHALRTLRLHCPEHRRQRGSGSGFGSADADAEPDDDGWPLELPGTDGSASPLRPHSPTFDAVGSLLAPLARMRALADLSLSFPISLARAGGGPAAAAALHPPLSHPLGRCGALRRLRLHRAPLSERQLAELLQTPALARQLECLALSFVEATDRVAISRAGAAVGIGAGTGTGSASAAVDPSSASPVDWHSLFGSLVRLRSLALSQCFIVSSLLPALPAAPLLGRLSVVCRAQPLGESADCGAVNPAPAAVRALLLARPRLQVRLAVAPTLLLWLAPIRAAIDADPRRHERDHCTAQWMTLRTLATDPDSHPDAHSGAADPVAHPVADHGQPGTAVGTSPRVRLVDRIVEADGEWTEEDKADATRQLR